MKKSLMDAVKRPFKPPTRVIDLTRSTSGVKSSGTLTKADTLSRLTALELHVTELQKQLEEVDVLIQNLFPEEDSEETEEMDESDY